MSLSFEEKWAKALKVGGGTTTYHNGSDSNAVALTQVDQAARRVLDVGGGPGYWAGKLSELNKTVYSIDINFNHMDVTAGQENVVRLCADAHDLPYIEEFFDCVYVSHTFEHLIAPYLALSEFNRVLKLTGQLILITPHATSSWLNDPHHVSVFNPEQQNALCEKAGFKRVYLNEAAGDSSYVAVYRKVKNIE